MVSVAYLYPASVILGVVLGVVAVLILRVRPLTRQLDDATALRHRLEIEKVRAEEAGQVVPGLQREVSELRRTLSAKEAEVGEATARLETERETHAARVEELERMGEEIERKFATLASRALGQNSDNFLKLVSERFEQHRQTAERTLEDRRKAIELLIKPVGESLTKFESRVGELEKAREGAYQQIREQVRLLAEGQTGLRQETSRLVQALRTPKTRGRWGEYQLRKVLEMAGMSEHVDFEQEQTINNGAAQLRPDVIVRLPGGKSIVVDAKTPLDAYLNAIEATSEAESERLVAAHVRQLREHVRQLGSKEYWRCLAEAPDFVVMFVPGEAFFSVAVEKDPGLFEQALRQKVLICTPTTFIALMKAIAYGWQQEKIAENAQQVGELARELYERLRVFGGHIGALGKSLRQAVERYNQTVGSLEGRVLPMARRFEDLHVTPTGSEISRLLPVDAEPRTGHAHEVLEDSTPAMAEA